MFDGHPINQPPHDVDLEQALFGAVLAKNGNMDAMGALSPEDFYDPVHRKLFSVMRDQWATSRAINVATLRAVIQSGRDITDTVSMGDYILKLVMLGDTTNLHALVETQRDYANRRRLVDAAAGMDASARDLSVAVQTTASIAVSGLDDVLSLARTTGPTRTTVGSAMRDMIDGIAADEGSARIPTGLLDLDRTLGGWRRKQLALLGGRPSMGKTSIANAAMLRTAKAGYGVLCFSLEMSTQALAARCLSDLSWSPDRRIPYADALAGRIVDRDLNLWAQTANAYKALPLTIDDQRGLTMAEIAARTRAEAQRMERAGSKLGLVVIDHLGLIKPSGRYAGNKVQEVGEVSDALCTLAKDQDVAVLALHQLNRGTEGRENKRPTMADLRNSGDLEQDADVVCFAYRESYYLERTKHDPGSQAELQRETALESCRNTLELIVAKNRNGEPKTITLFCDMACNVVRDLAR